MGMGVINRTMVWKNAFKYCFLVTAFLLHTRSMDLGSMALPISAMVNKGVIISICQSACMPLAKSGKSVNFVSACKKNHMILAPTKYKRLNLKLEVMWRASLIKWKINWKVCSLLEPPVKWKAQGNDKRRVNASKLETISSMRCFFERK